MQPIRMVDLAGQHKKIKAELDAAINEVMDTTAFIKGPQVAAFEKELATFLGVKHVTGVANGTDALQIALMALNLPEGAEVITPDFTFVATAEVVRLLKLTPVLVDCDPFTFNIDPEAIEAAITEKTRVIIPVHLFGQCANMESIMGIASRHDLYVIEDTAQATGADCLYHGNWLKAGTIGHIGTTSFFPSKNLGAAGDGGAVFTNHSDLDKKIKIMANHGQGSQYFYEEIGVNSRLDTLQAAVLRVKLQKLGEYNKARQNAADAYDAAFKNNPALIIPSRAAFSSHIFHQYTLRITNSKRDELAHYLNEKGIPNKVYYPMPIHENEPYKNACRYDVSKLKITELLAREVLSLPMHTELDDEQITFIANTVNSFF